MSRLRSREGATLVLVAILMTVLVGFTGIGIDAARLYVMRAQLQTTADAAAIAAIVEVNDKRPTNATTVAVSYAAKNTVEQNTPSITAGGVEPGSWNYATNTFTPLASWTDPALAAVRVTATYPGAYTFARVFGVTNKTVSARAVAAVGWVSTTSCLRPWTVSYQTMLDILYPPAGTKNPSYNLTPTDIQTLSGMSSPANLITLLNSTNNQLTNGNIAQVQTNTPWNGNNAYKDAITGCSNMPIGPGTILHGDPGAGSGQTAAALKQLCGVNGNGNNGFNCNVQVKLAMWDQNNGLNGANLTVRVKYVGVFTVTRFDPGQGPGNPPDQIKGYFNTMASSGAFSATPGPVTGSMALVQ